jgi:hypothetical protein
MMLTDPVSTPTISFAATNTLFDATDSRAAAPFSLVEALTSASRCVPKTVPPRKQKKPAGRN